MLPISCLVKKNRIDLHELANGKKRSVIFEFGNSLKLTETKNKYTHIFACRSMTKITRSRVSKLNNYTLSNEKNIKAYNLISSEKIYCTKSFFSLIYCKLKTIFVFTTELYKAIMSY